MEKPVTRAEVALLFISATCYKFAKDTPKLIEPANDAKYRHSSIFAFIIEYACLSFFLKDQLYLGSNVVIISISILIPLQLILSYTYSNKIAMIGNNYFNYYNNFLYILFVILLMVSVAYIFNSMIGTGGAKYKHRYF